MHLLPLLLPLALLTTATLASTQKNLSLPFLGPGDHSLTKRWYGVRVPTSNNEALNGWGPWPKMCPNTPQETMPLRYCFKDARAHTNLAPILDAAVTKWAPAMQHSKMTIALDNTAHPVCGPAYTRPDTLIISDETVDGDPDHNWAECETQSTTGYLYDSTDARGRHTLEFCELKPDAVDYTTPYAVRSMMHELGHALGLTHEHQRPDRSDHLIYYCRHLPGYEAARRAVMIDEHALFEDDQDESERLECCCYIEEFARVYLPEAVAYLKPGQMADDTERKVRYEGYTSSTKFDLNSIMMYNSEPGGQKQGTLKTWVLADRNKKAVWMGGSLSPHDASISVGDVARIAQLYEGTEAAKNEAEWGAAQEADLKVKIRDGPETIVRPARKRRGVDEL